MSSDKFYKITNITISIMIIILSLFVMGYTIFYPKITLKGSTTVTLNYKEMYKEKGYKAKILLKDITNLVKVNGKINSKKLGNYKIEYTINYHGLKNKTTRYVEVKDLVAPVIKLTGGNPNSVCPGTKYKEEGFTATDNYDGDLTKKVEVRNEEDYVTYTVHDKAGNVTVVKRKLVYEDKTPPEVKTNGDIKVAVGGKVNPTYSATDNCDGEITKNVKKEGSFDTNKEGTYTLKYTVSDKAGNKAEATQKITIYKPAAPGTIYLTFDDGPQSGTTNVILDILKEEGVPATFFITNKGDDSLVQREFNEGHTVAIHTASHDYAVVYRSVDSYWNDLNIVQNRIKRITGSETRIVRFPGGSSNTVSRRYSTGIMTTLTNDLINKGYKYYDWNISSGDAAGGSPTPNQIYNNVINQLSHDRINMVLMHDIKWYTRDALRDIIRYAKNNGYTFERITYDTPMVRQRVNN